MQTLVTIGTDDGVWAPPRPVELVLTMDHPCGLAITNANEVRWTAEARGEVSRAAIAVGTGEWKRLDLSGVTRVVADQDIVLGPGVLVIDVNLTSVELAGQHRLIDASRRLLGKTSTDRE